ncbi:MAG: helix-turn-helix domain-containing protein [Solirubrobacterales bacterium]|nr:helix-turn-helix domain-containing protein [Solirubrobacterales bacterium]
MGPLLTAAEVAERLGYTERYVWRLGREGALPRVKVPGRKYVRFCERDVERFMARCRSGVGVSAGTRRPVVIARPPRF